MHFFVRHEREAGSDECGDAKHFFDGGGLEYFKSRSAMPSRLRVLEV